MRHNRNRGWWNKRGLLILGAAGVTAVLATESKADAPVILTQPASQTARLGASVTFVVTASGDPKPDYQWRFNGTDLSGKISTTLYLPSVQATQFGSYSVQVSNAFGEVISAEAVLSPTEVVQWGLGGYGKWRVPSNLTNVIAIAAGYQHCLALTRDGRVVAWGTNIYGQCNVPSDLCGVVAIAAGAAHSMALKADGTVVVWGAGRIITTNWPNFGQCLVPADLTNVVAIAAGALHSLALKADGLMVAWGAGMTDSGAYPNYGQSVIPADLRNVVAIAGGVFHSLALKADGSVVTVAFNDYPAVDPDFPNLAIARPPGLTDVVGIAAGSYHNVVLKSNGKVAAWGENWDGQAEVPPGSVNLVALAAGGYHAIGVKADGKVAPCSYYWDGTMVWVTNATHDAWWTTPHLVPMYVPSGLSNVVAVSANGDFNLALVGTGKPALVERPLDRVVRPGGSALFRVSPSGAWPLHCQWRLNGTDLPGATNRFLLLRNVRETNAGAYTAVVTNSLGAFISGQAMLTVDGVPPSLSITSPADLQLVAGGSILVSGTATDAGRGDEGIALVTVSGLRATNDTVPGAGTACWSRRVSINGGKSSIKVVATDTAGNTTTNYVHVTCDATRPTVTITNLVANQRVSNSVFMAMGKATDNFGLSHVWFRLNGGEWADAGVGPGWKASLELSPGLNLLEVVGEDTVGNRSWTNHTALVCVPCERLLVEKVGQGSVAPNYSDTLLALGTNYSMTATPSTGHKFVQWILTRNGNSLTVAASKLTFTMQSNLTLTAVFLDTNRPTVAITSPLSNQRVSNAVVVARGTAKDNVGISNLWCRLNGAAWERRPGSVLWTNLLILRPGTNTLEVYAEDTAGNRSATGLVRFVGVFAPSNVASSLRASLVREAAGGGQLRLVVPAGSARTVGVQVSTDLLHWETLGVFTNSTRAVEVPLPDVLARPEGYYRVIPLP